MCLTHVARCTKTCIAFVGPWGKYTGTTVEIDMSKFGTENEVDVQLRSLHRKTVGFRRHLPRNQRHTLAFHTRSHIAGDTRDEGHVESLRPPKSKPQPKLRKPKHSAHTQRIENTWWGVKRSMLRTRPNEDLFESCLQEWLCFSTMEMIHLDTLSSISPTCMKYAKMRKLFLVPLYALEERNEIHSFRPNFVAFDLWRDTSPRSNRKPAIDQW